MPGGDTVLIGWVARAHGVRGAVRTRASGPTLAALEPGEVVTVRGHDGGEASYRIESRTGVPDRPILQLHGVSDRGAAVALAESEIRVPEDRVPPIPDPDTFYVKDLLGFRVLVGESELGVVRAVHPGRANDALEVGSDDEGVVLIPFTADALVDLDRSGRVMIVRGDLLGRW